MNFENEFLNKVPPTDIFAEEQLLSSVFIDSDCLYDILGILTDEE